MNRLLRITLLVFFVFSVGCTGKENVEPTATPSVDVYPTLSPIVINPDPTGTPNPSPVFNLHIEIMDEDYRPVAAKIRIEWPDTGGSFTAGPTSDIELPVPVDAVDGSPSVAIVVIVEAQGFHTIEQPFEVSLHQDFDFVLAVRLSPVGETPDDSV